jgi:hypothetical protein
MDIEVSQSDDNNPRVSLSQIIEELWKEGEDGMREAHRRANTNEHAFHGRVRDLSYTGEDNLNYRYKPSRNLLRNMCQTWCARVNEDRPSIKAYPAQPEQEDVLAAEASNAYLEHLYRFNNFDRLMWDVALYAQLHGMSAVKCCWDPDAGDGLFRKEVDPLTGEPVMDEDGRPKMVQEGSVGEVTWEVQTIFDFRWGGADRVEDAEWVIFESWADKYVGRSFIQDAGMSDQDVSDMSEETYKDPTGRERHGVRVLEFWHRPGGRFEEGLYAVSVGGVILKRDNHDHPYDHGELPIVTFRVNPVRGTKYCTSHVDDALPLQLFVNELEEVKAETIRKTGVPRLVILQKLLEEIEQGVHMMGVDDFNEVAQGARYLEPPKPSELVWGSQRDTEESMFNVFGLNEVLTGKDSVKSGTSAKQIAYLNRLDSMKLSGFVREMEVGLMRLCRMSLGLGRQYIRADRWVTVLGDMNDLQRMALSGANLTMDIILEPQSGMERFRAQAAAEAEQDLQAGKVSPQAGMEMAETGLDQTLKAGDMEKMAVNWVVQVAQSGQETQPPEGVSPAAILKAISQAKGLLGESQVLNSIEMKYRQMAQQQAQANMQTQGGKPPQGPRPGGPR